MKIQKIQKMPSGKYKVIFDDHEKLITYDDVILKNGLLFSKELDFDIINQLQIDTAYYDLYHKIIVYISKRLRSEKEVREYLDKYTKQEKDKEKIIENLKNIGLINDENYAKAFLADQFHLTSNGPYKIKAQLLEHNIPENIIDSLLATIPIEEIKEKINKMIQKKAKNNHSHSAYIFKKKLYQELINLGYDSDIIQECLNQLVIENVIEKEFDKWYRKYQNKKEGFELYQIIRQKLYQKGYKMDEINEIINKKMES